MRAIALVLAVLVCAAAVMAESQPSDKKEQVAHSNAVAAKNSSGSASAPTVVPKTEPTAANKHPNKSNANGDEKLSAEIQIAKFTAQLSNYTLALVVVTGFLVIAAIWQGRLLRAQIKLAQQEFVIAHRPRIRVHGVQIHYGHLNKPDGILFVIANDGDTIGTVVGDPNINIRPAVYMPNFMKGWPAIPPYGSQTIKLSTKTFKPEERLPVLVQSEEINETLMHLIESGEQTLSFFGYLHFVDDVGNQRPHAFYWKYDASNSRFAEVENIDYKYG